MMLRNIVRSGLRAQGTRSLAAAPSLNTMSKRTIVGGSLDEFNTRSDNYFESERKPIDRQDPTGRTHTYMAVGASKFMYASIVRLGAIKLISSMSASADVLALSTVEVDIGAIAPGQVMTVKFRGSPVFIRHRTPAQIEEAGGVDLSELRDPEADADRANNPAFVVCLGVCTHLGCVPISNAGDYEGGWFCPCHGSHYDNCGRIRLGPAPLNLPVPDHKFLTPTNLLIG